MELMRRRGMMEIKQAVTPTLIYSLPSSTTTQNYDTGLKLFESPMDFTILCDATWNHYSWSSGNQQRAIYGVATANLFRTGRAQQMVDYVNGLPTNKDNRYFGLIAPVNGEAVVSSIYARGSNSAVRRKYAVRYNSVQLLVQASITSPDIRAYERCTIPLTSQISTTDTLKLLINGASGTVHQLEVYSGLLTQTQTDTWLNS